jgi:small subunit ribosomal protein S18
MPPPPKRKRPSARAVDQRKPRRGKPKVCAFCAEHSTWVDYKDVNLLRRFLSDRGKIRSRSNTGTCAQHQRDVATAIKTARELALLPYAVRVAATDKPGGRGGRPRGGDRRAEAGEAGVAAPTDVIPEGEDDEQATSNGGQAAAGVEQADEGSGEA